MIQLECRSVEVSDTSSMRSTCSETLGVTRSFLIQMSKRRVIRYSGNCVPPINKTGILIGIITQESASFRDQPGISHFILGIQVTHHADGKTAAKAGREVQSKQGPRG